MIRLRLRRAPWRLREEVMGILRDQGFTPVRSGERSVRYWRIGKWLVRSDHMRSFLRLKSVGMKELLAARLLRFAPTDATRRFPLLLPREYRYPKVSFFDPERRIKRVVWLYSMDFERETLATDHFSRLPCRVPESLAADRDSLVLEQRLVGEFLGSEPSMSSLVSMITDFHAATCPEVVPLDRYLVRHSRLTVESPLGADVSERVARQLRECLAECEGHDRGVPVTLVHGDLAPRNAFTGDQGELFINDFDKAMVATATYDLVYLHATDPRFDRASLLTATRVLNAKLGVGCPAADPDLYRWVVRLFLFDLHAYAVDRAEEDRSDCDKVVPYSLHLIQWALGVLESMPLRLAAADPWSRTSARGGDAPDAAVETTAQR